jgi:hypothetical protein
LSSALVEGEVINETSHVRRSPDTASSSSSNARSEDEVERREVKAVWHIEARMYVTYCMHVCTHVGTSPPASIVVLLMNEELISLYSTFL